MSKRRRPPATSLGPRGRAWRRRIGGALLVCAAYVPQLAAVAYPLDWHGVDYGKGLSLLPGVVLTAVFAPRVGYRRRDALALLFVFPGVRFAWIIGTRLGQLPHRTWPVRTDGIELQGRQATRIAVAVYRYRSWRQRWSRGYRREVPSVTPIEPMTSMEPVTPIEPQVVSWRQKWSRGDRTKPGLRS